MKRVFYTFLIGIVFSFLPMENEEISPIDGIIKRIETIINNIPADHSENEFVQEIELEKKVHEEYLTMLKSAYNCGVNKCLQKDPYWIKNLDEKVLFIEKESTNKENDLQKLLIYMAGFIDKKLFHENFFSWLKSYCAVQASKAFAADHC